MSDVIGSKKAVEQLGIAYYNFKKWKNRRILHGDGVRIGSGRYCTSFDKTAREIESEREIGELRSANEILKDALGFFAKDREW
ncbi:transposase [Paenibacillus gorillae]|uniref:transposase n=1 Tax=Paenibacillus gorillae TaxID=1243662 RepID=UPI0012DF97C2|nr:transposase [Paenibacillus gorillae]